MATARGFLAAAPAPAPPSQSALRLCAITAFLVTSAVGGGSNTEQLYESGASWSADASASWSADASTSSSADSSTSSESSGSSDTKQLRKACCEVLSGSYADQAEASKKLDFDKDTGFGALWGVCKDAVGPANEDTYRGALQPPVSDGVVDEAAIAECFDGSLIPTSTSTKPLATTTASLASRGSAAGVHNVEGWGYMSDTASKTVPNGETTTPLVPTNTEPTTWMAGSSSTDTVTPSTSQIVTPTESPATSGGPITTSTPSASEIVTSIGSLTTFTLTPSTSAIDSTTEPTPVISTTMPGNPCATTLFGGGNPCATTGGATEPIPVEPNMPPPTPAEPIPVEPNFVTTIATTTTTSSGFPEEEEHPMLPNLAQAIGHILGTNTETTTEPPAATTELAPPAPTAGAQTGTTTLYSVPTNTNAGSSGSSGSGSSSSTMAWLFPILGLCLICCIAAVAAGLSFTLFKKLRGGSKSSRAVRGDGYDKHDSEQERFMEEEYFGEHQEPWMGMPEQPYGAGPGPMPPMVGPPPMVTPVPMQTSFVGPPVVATSFSLQPQAAPVMTTVMPPVMFDPYQV